ncbi:MAG: insulinase family protein [Clostridia bacterium]|nr:insulinase family protein [Clostridia bacterium]
MTYQKNDSLHGFTITSVRPCEKLHGNFVEMVHKQSGASLCWVDNKTENKLFCVGFKTLPENDTGVFHILEHSVLCGSKKFPIKEPFVELLKGSMNTFLNAMTYPDKTIYPVSSRNEKDFLNLTECYLDAVFAPALLDNSLILMQEGWHIDTSNDTPAYVGVVFNEMKGCASSVDDQMETEIERLLFPDTCYHYNSGGNPVFIPDLTYEEFVSTYKKYYHPSNARIFLDGDIPLDKTLALIDSYLCNYQAKPIDFDVETQTPKVGSASIFYDNPEEQENADYLAFGKIVGAFDNPTKLAALTILCGYLCDTNESPLKKALLQENLANDVQLFVTDGIKQPYAMLVLRQTSVEKEEAIRRVIIKTIKEILQTGIPQEDLLAGLNKLEYDSRQTPEPQGLYRATASYQSWLYGGDPLLYLDTDTIFAPIRQQIQKGEMDALLKELLGDLSLWSTLRVKASSTIGTRLEKEEQKRLYDRLQNLTKDEQNALKQQNEELNAWQQTPDTKEQLDTLPKLSLSDVGPKPQDIPTKLFTMGTVQGVYHELPTNGITSVSLFFPLSAYSLEDLSKLNLLCDLLSELPTKRHSVSEIHRLIKTYIGSLSFRILCASPDKENLQIASPYFLVHFTALNQNVEKAKEIVLELLTKYDFDHPEKVKEVVTQLDELVNQSAINSGHSLAAHCARSHFSAQGAVHDALFGYSYFHFIRCLAKNLEKETPKYIDFINSAFKTFIQMENPLLSVTAESLCDMKDFLEALPKGTKQPTLATYKSPLPLHMAIPIPSQIAFTAKSYRLKDNDPAMHGSLMVASNILSLSYLWNQVRVQGGAYGVGMDCSRLGCLTDFSYRDPSPASSIEVFNDSATFLKAFAESDEEELDKFIISQIATSDPLQTPLQQGVLGDTLYLNNISFEDRTKLREEMLSTTRESLKEWLDALSSFAKEGADCVVASESLLKTLPDGYEILKL